MGWLSDYFFWEVVTASVLGMPGSSFPRSSLKFAAKGLSSLVCLPNSTLLAKPPSKGLAASSKKLACLLNQFGRLQTSRPHLARPLLADG